MCSTIQIGKKYLTQDYSHYLNEMYNPLYNLVSLVTLWLYRTHLPANLALLVLTSWEGQEGRQGQENREWRGSRKMTAVGWHEIIAKHILTKIINVCFSRNFIVYNRLKTLEKVVAF